MQDVELKTLDFFLGILAHNLEYLSAVSLNFQYPKYLKTDIIQPHIWSLRLSKTSLGVKSGAKDFLLRLV